MSETKHRMRPATSGQIHVRTSQAEQRALGEAARVAGYRSAGQYLLSMAQRDRLLGELRQSLETHIDQRIDALAERVAADIQQLPSRSNMDQMFKLLVRAIRESQRGVQ